MKPSTRQYTDDMVKTMRSALSKPNKKLVVALEGKLRMALIRLNHPAPVVLTKAEQAELDACYALMTTVLEKVQRLQAQFTFDSPRYTPLWRSFNYVVDVSADSPDAFRVTGRKIDRTAIETAEAQLHNVFGFAVETLLESEVTASTDAATILDLFTIAVNDIVDTIVKVEK